MSTTVIIVRFETSAVAGQPDAGWRRIVVPLDGSAFSRAALVPAEELARRTGARLELLSTKVAEGPPRPTSFLDDLADEISERSGDVELRTATRTEADPAQAIEAAIEEDRARALIVMSSHGRGRVRRTALGSTAELVVASGSAPVLIVGPSFEAAAFDPDGAVVVAHDGEHEPALDVIGRMARAATGRVTLLQVFHPSLPLGRGEGGTVVSDAVAESANRVRAMGLEVLTEAERGAQTHRVIVDAAVDLGASSVAVTSRGRTGARRAVLGSVAAGVVRSSPIPVLVSRAA